MKKFFILVALFVSGCVFLADERLQKVEKFPTISNSDKVSVRLVIDEQILLDSYPSNISRMKIMLKERFEKSLLFKDVYINDEQSDFTVIIKKHRDTLGFDSIKRLKQRPTCYINQIPGLLTFMIAPAFCEDPVSTSEIIEVINNTNNEKQKFIYEYGYTEGWGILTWLIIPFNIKNTSNAFNHLDIMYDNYALKTYWLIKNMKK